MTMKITDDELMQIRERADKATEGPWDDFDEDWHGNVYEYDSLTETAVDFIATCETDNKLNDADFIANAREDIPKLLAEIDRLKERVGEATSLLHLDTELIDKQAAEIKRMREGMYAIYEIGTTSGSDGLIDISTDTLIGYGITELYREDAKAGCKSFREALNNESRKLN